MWEEVEYWCETCEHAFVVYHNNEQRNSHCWWCEGPVELTGVVNKVEGDEVVTYKDGVQVSRRPKPKVRQICPLVTTDSISTDKM